MTAKTAVIAYCSPAGTTRHVARVIESAFRDTGGKTVMLDLAKQADTESAISQIREAGEDICLFVGSPVYASHAIPPVTDFIAKLPENTGFAVPFATWGGATSGIALYEMAKAFKEKGMKVVGAAKVLAVHSMMWQCEAPLGKDHPDAEDDEIVRQLVHGVSQKLSGDGASEIPLSDLAYQSQEAHAQMEKVTLKMAKAKMPVREVDEDLCTQCDTCTEVCPTNAIILSPYPQFGDNCIVCFNCVRECPENAIKADVGKMEGPIRARAEQFAEQPFTQAFL